MIDIIDLGRRRLPVVQGVEATECGLACMTMVARFHGHDVDLGGMRQHFPLSMTGATLRSMMALAERLGLATRALRTDIRALHKVRTPAILHWDLNHFVVLKQATRRAFVLHDPALGRRKLNTAELSKHFTGVVLEVMPTARIQRVAARQKTRLRDLWSRIDGFWPALLQVLGLSVILQVAVFVGPFYLQLTVDEAIGTGDVDLLSVLALGFGGLLFLRVSVTTLRAWALQAIGFLLGFQMVGNLVHHLLRLKTEFFEKRHVGDILSRMGSSGPIQAAITQGVISTIIDGAMAVIAAMILFLYSSTLAWLVVGMVLLSLVVTFALYPAQRLRTEEQIIAGAREQSHLIETVRASTVVKVMGREVERENAWRNHFAEVTNASFGVGKLSIVMTSSQGLIAGLQTILVVYFASRTILAGEGFSIGMLFAFLSYRQTFTDRCMALINQLVQFSYLRLHLDRVGDIVHAPRDVVDDSPTMEETSGAVSARKLSFRYGSTDALVLDNVDLDIPVGAFVAVIGPSGGGKTTLLKLLLGLYPPTSGEILLDGRPATPAMWRRWRADVGVVAQDDLLLSGTIADNIAFFDPDIEMSRVQEAAGAAKVHEDIARMPMQYLSLVGDMGAALSSGQRQRILLARALYRRPKILILDEGTANLDPLTEAQIVELVASMPITRIVVAHRPALVNAADTAYWVANGKIARLDDEDKQSPYAVR